MRQFSGDWWVCEFMALAFSLWLGIILGVWFHMRLVDHFGWTYDEETGTWQ